MNTKKKLLATSIALAMSGGLFVPHANAMEVKDSGYGQVLLAPLYLADSAFSTEMVIVNESTNYAVRAKVVLRTQKRSDEVLDYVLYLTPGDVYRGNFVYKTSSLSSTPLPHLYSTDDSGQTIESQVGAPIFATETKPTDFPFFDVKLSDSTDTNRLGHIEVFGTYAVGGTNSAGNVVGVVNTATSTVTFVTVKKGMLKTDLAKLFDHPTSAAGDVRPWLVMPVNNNGAVQTTYSSYYVNGVYPSVDANVYYPNPGSTAVTCANGAVVANNNTVTAATSNWVTCQNGRYTAATGGTLLTASAGVASSITPGMVQLRGKVQITELATGVRAVYDMTALGATDFTSGTGGLTNVITNDYYNALPTAETYFGKDWLNDFHLPRATQRISSALTTGNGGSTQQNIAATSANMLAVRLDGSPDISYAGDSVNATVLSGYSGRDGTLAGENALATKILTGNYDTTTGTGLVIGFITKYRHRQQISVSPLLNPNVDQNGVGENSVAECDAVSAYSDAINLQNGAATSSGVNTSGAGYYSYPFQGTKSGGVLISMTQWDNSENATTAKSNNIVFSGGVSKTETQTLNDEISFSFPNWAAFAKSGWFQLSLTSAPYVSTTDPGTDAACAGIAALGNTLRYSFNSSGVLNNFVLEQMNVCSASAGAPPCY